MATSRGRTLVPSEHQEQASLFVWADLMSSRYPELALMFAIPNGANKSFLAAKKFKAEGLKSGVPDVCLPVARGAAHGLYIEMKRTRGGHLDPEQKWWHERLREQGYIVAVALGWVQAKEIIERYLKGELL